MVFQRNETETGRDAAESARLAGAGHPAALLEKFQMVMGAPYLAAFFAFFSARFSFSVFVGCFFDSFFTSMALDISVSFVEMEMMRSC
jgi:hypothetical protein